MPQVPKVESTETLKALPGIRTNPNAPLEAFGGGQVAQTVQRAAQQSLGVAQNIFEEEKKKADDVATTEAFTKAVRARNARMYDPKEGAMNRTGKNAFGVGEEYGKLYQQDLDAIESELANDDQRALFQKIRIQQESEFQNDLTKFTFQEARKFEDQTTESGLAVSRDDAVLNYQNPGKVEQSIATQEALIKSYAERNGLGGEYVKLKLTEARSKTHSAVIDRMLANGSDLEAQSYFEKVKGDLSGADSVALEKSLEEGTRRGMAQRESDSIFRSVGSLSQALEKARDIEDPRLRDEVTTRLKENFALKKLAENERLEQLHKQAGNIIDSTGGDFDKIPPNILAQFSVSEKASLRAYARNKKEGIEPSTDWEEYYNLRTQASTPALRNEFLQTNLMLYRNKMRDSEFKELVKLQEDMRTGNPEVEKTLDGIRSDNEIVETALKEINIDPNAKKNTEDLRRSSLFKRKVDEEIVKLQQRTGKKATSQEVQQIVDDLRIEAITNKSSWFFIPDTRKMKFEAEPGEKLEFTIDSIPPAERIKIEEALRKNKKPVSDESILQLFTVMQNRGK